MINASVVPEQLLSLEAPVERSGVDMGMMLLPRFVDSTIARACALVAMQANNLDDQSHTGVLLTYGLYQIDHRGCDEGGRGVANQRCQHSRSNLLTIL